MDKEEHYIMLKVSILQEDIIINSLKEKNMTISSDMKDN